MTRSRFRFALLIAAVSMLAAPASRASEEPAVVRTPYALVISGGVSLGAYEAGAIWAFTRHLRQRALFETSNDRRVPHLAGVTGASAGGINAVIVALTWCAAADEPTSGSIEDNLFAKVWLPVGLDALLPPDKGRWEEVYDRGPFPDGVLSRQAFAAPLNALGRFATGPNFLPGCEIPFAVTVTRANPARSRVAGLEVGNQRFAVPLVLRVGADGRARFGNDTRATMNEALIGQYAYLPERCVGDRCEMDFDQILQLIQATSAFPLAFSPVALTHCLPLSAGAAGCPEETDLPETPPDAGADYSCEGISARVEGSFCRARSRFVDGGFFDNVPLGVAMAQVEVDRHDLSGSAPDEGDDSLWSRRREVHGAAPRYVYFDPDIRRDPGPSPEPTDAGARGLQRVFDILGSAVTTARNYELHSLLRFTGFNQSPARLVDALELLGRRTVEALAATALSAPLPSPGQCWEACMVAIEDAARVQGEGSISCSAWPSNCLACRPSGEVEEAVSGPLEPSPIALEQAREFVDSLGWLTAFMDCRASTGGVSEQEFALLAELVGQLHAWTGKLIRQLAATDPSRRAESLGRQLDVLAYRARQYYAATLFGSGGYYERRLVLPRRFAPLAASQLGNFGAFLDRRFREHDYYVGVHDAIWTVALHMAAGECGERVWASTDQGRAAADRCFMDELLRVADGVGIATSERGAYLFDRLAAEATAKYRAGAGAERTFRYAGDASTLPCDRLDAPFGDLCLVHEALVSCASDQATKDSAGRSFCLHDRPFEAFVASLASAGFAPRSWYLKRIFEDPVDWWTEPARLALERLGMVQEAERDEAEARAAHARDPALVKAHRAASRVDALGRTGVALGEIGLRTYTRGLSPTLLGLDLDPSTVPNGLLRWEHALPYRIGVNAAVGGLVVGYEPRWFWSWGELRLLLDVLHLRASPKVELATALSPALTVEASRPVLGFIGFGPTAEYSWTAGAADFGAAIYFDLLAEKLRLSVGNRLCRYDPAGVGSCFDGWAGRWDVVISLTDLPGLVYWLSR